MVKKKKRKYSKLEKDNLELRKGADL